MNNHIPFNCLYNPTLQALHNLGGSGANKEIYDEVVKILDLSDEQLSVLISPEKKQLNSVAFRLGWVRSYMKRYGLIENPRRGFWALTEKGRNTEQVDPVDLVRTVQQMIEEEKARKRND